MNTGIIIMVLQPESGLKVWRKYCCRTRACRKQKVSFPLSTVCASRFTRVNSASKPSWTMLPKAASLMACFAYLKDLPISSVKIDGRFVRNLYTGPIDQTMVKAMNDIALALGKKTLAEDDAQGRLLE